MRRGRKLGDWSCDETRAKKVISFFQEKIGVTPSVSVPGDTNPSDATAHRYAMCYIG